MSEPAAVATIKKAALAMTNELTMAYIMSHCTQMDKDHEVLEKECEHVLAEAHKQAKPVKPVEPVVTEVAPEHGVVGSVQKRDVEQGVQQVVAAGVHAEPTEESMEVEPNVDMSGDVVVVAQSHCAL